MVRDAIIGHTRMVRRLENEMNQFMFTIDGATEFSGLARSRLYELMGRNEIEARKAGRRTLIVGDSLRSYLANLPAATIRAPAIKA